MTKTGVVMGTPWYMAPEQAQGIKEIDHRIDIYAVGVILYQALTGQLPFQGNSYNEVIAKIWTASFPPPSSLNASVSIEVEAVVLRAMSRDPSERHSSADEMRQALETAAVSSEPVANSSSVPIETTVKAEPSSRTSVPAQTSKNKSLFFPVLFVLIIAALSILGFIFAMQNSEETPVSTPTVDQLGEQQKSEPFVVAHQEPDTETEAIRKSAAVKENVDQRTLEAARQTRQTPQSQRNEPKAISRTKGMRQDEASKPIPRTSSRIDTTYGEIREDDKDSIKGRNRTQIQTDYNGL